MSVDKQRDSGAQRNGVSKYKDEGEGKRKKRTLAGGKKKRGREQAAARATKFEEAREYTRRRGKTDTEGFNREEKGKGAHKNNLKLLFNETTGLMEKRQQKYADVSQAAVQEEAERVEEGQESRKSYEAEERYRATIDKTKVQIYGTLRVKKRLTTQRGSSAVT